MFTVCFFAYQVSEYLLAVVVLKGIYTYRLSNKMANLTRNIERINNDQTWKRGLSEFRDTGDGCLLFQGFRSEERVKQTEDRIKK